MRNRYVCVSKSCRHEVEIDTPVAHTNGSFLKRTCDECGSEMKKVYVAPSFTRLSQAEAECLGDFEGLIKKFKTKAAG